ncbi:MAG: hypothetical protein D6731_07500 [Planctomycetota bacterium]|nr:MAG: hypothetical protein D6731_07500 [Planctomycetota bacterium]
MRVELRERTLGELLGVSLSLAADRFGALFLLLFVCNLPQVLVQAFLVPDPTPLDPALGSPVDPAAFFRDFFAAMGVWVPAALIPYPFLQTAATLVAAQAFAPEERPLSWVLRRSLRLYPRALLVLAAIGLLNVVGVCPGMFVGYFVFAAWFYVALPVAVLEDRGWLEALQRSRALARGHFGVLLALFLALHFAVPFVIAPFAALFQFAFMNSPWAIALLQGFLGMVVGVFPIVGPVVAYHHLRVVREHYDIQRLAELVDAVAPDGVGARS